MQKPELRSSKRTTVTRVTTGVAEQSPRQLENLLSKLRNWSGEQKCLSLKEGEGGGAGPQPQTVTGQ